MINVHCLVYARAQSIAGEPVRRMSTLGRCGIPSRRVSTGESTSKGSSDQPGGNTRRGWGRRGLLLLHWVIIVNFSCEIFYSMFMIFSVLRPEGVSGPLWGAATSIPHDLLVARRLYAIEGWIAIAGLAIYLAITEIGPRLRAGTTTTG